MHVKDVNNDLEITRVIVFSVITPTNNGVEPGSSDFPAKVRLGHLAPLCFAQKTAIRFQWQTHC